MSMNELAGRLNITNGALTAHVRRLEECGILRIFSESAGHGNLKKCSVALDKILIELDGEEKADQIYEVSIKVGHFTDCQVWPTCGLASREELIGEVDDVRYFAHPDRFDADILWFTRGYVEYAVPNFIPTRQRIDQITISAELGSEAPGAAGKMDGSGGFRRCARASHAGLVVCGAESVWASENADRQS